MVAMRGTGISSSKNFISNYTAFVGYKTCDKLLCTSDKDCRNTNKISKQGIPKININMTSPSSILEFGYSPHKRTPVISCQKNWFLTYCKHVYQKMRGVY